ncbi:hypothetical protein EYC80_005170 [Monilinia laxa]|uniref:Uncharacterized protein n=1 Tax=Monilinia laxa TaxID=61186 RepID=A0A5N6KJD6_MONLA|nr:hypothetical protein EYC80_005170 [Monilinia laxa]
MTSLFNTLTSTDSPSDHAPASPPKPHLSSIAPHRPRDTRPVDAGNRLRGVAPEKKALLMTLHVIFPPPLLLQALDLLDRGGVVKLILWEGGDDDDGKDDGRLELEEGSKLAKQHHLTDMN